MQLESMYVLLDLRRYLQALDHPYKKEHVMQDGPMTGYGDWEDECDDEFPDGFPPDPTFPPFPTMEPPAPTASPTVEDTYPRTASCHHRDPRDNWVPYRGGADTRTNCASAS
eukprot:Em0032g27a